MTRTLVGPKIRARRRALGMTQVALAAAVGISASYLNLIESDKRSIAGRLLTQIADALGLTVDELDGASERRLLADLRELAGDPLLASLHIDPDSAAELAGRHADWGQALVRLHRACTDRERTVLALSDRLKHDPFLGDAVHAMLTQLSAVRSAAEILRTFEDLAPEDSARFVRIVGAESERLSNVAQALAAFFDRARTPTRSTTPVEEVDDFLLDHDNYFPALEALAADVRRAAAKSGACTEESLVAHLQRAHGVEIEFGSDASSAAHEPAGHEPSEGRTQLPRAAPPASRRFLLAAAASDLLDAAEGRRVVETALASPLLTSEAARRRARRVLLSYAAGAVVLPYEEFYAAAVALRYDVAALAERFGASFEQVCHRLVTLRRPGMAGVAFGLMRIDPAGYVSKRFSLPRLPLPRHGNACPLWAVYGAFQTVGAIVRQLAAFPTGDRFLFVARTVEKGGQAFGLPRRLLSIMLACDALQADQTIYAQGMDFTSTAPAVPVGSNCRLCVRRECRHREEDPIIDA